MIYLTSFFVLVHSSSAGQECSVTNIQAHDLQCFGDTYSMKITFDIESVDGPVDVWVLPEYYGTFPQEDTVYVSNVPGLGGLAYIRICSSQEPTCCASLEFEQPACIEWDSCKWTNVYTELQECDEEGFFSILVDFDYENTDIVFAAFIDDIFYQDYSYSELPVLLGPFDGHAEDGFTLFLRDIFSWKPPIDDGCQFTIEVPAMVCDPLGSEELDSNPQASIMYNERGPFVIARAHTRYEIYSISGRFLAELEEIVPEIPIYLSEVVDYCGVMILHELQTTESGEHLSHAQKFLICSD